MAIVQDVWNSAPATGFPGMVANGETHNTISRTVEDVAGIPFGAPAFRGSGDRGCTKTVGTLATFLGFVEADHGQPVLPGGVAADIVPRYQSAGIRTLGGIYVTVQDDVTDGAAVYIDAATGGITDTTTSNIATGGWVFDDTVAAGGICRINRR